MHSFTELVVRCATFTFKTLEEANAKTIEEQQTSSATSLVKTLQMVQLQKVIFAVDMFSIFLNRTYKKV
jgi:phosphoribosylaminoimidazole-succinocarboxamide synthase